ncbi:MAG: hypothetical protein M3R44_06745 [Candidatus Eremiobacteraeota bacterium]|nr:hypothetical protein [Candidatus Eremiobacteraeota bacterium]
MKDDRFPPPGTDESISKRGEDTAKESNEPGFTEKEDDSTGRRVGGKTARVKTAIDPQDPVDPSSPNLPPG